MVLMGYIIWGFDGVRTGTATCKYTHCTFHSGITTRVENIKIMAKAHAKVQVNQAHIEHFQLNCTQLTISRKGQFSHPSLMN